MTLHHGLVSFHFQEPVPDWTRAVAALPAGTVVKSVDNIGLLVEAQRVNAGILPFFRKWADFSPGQHYDGADMATKRDRAKNYFETFINDPELRRLNNLIIGCWNEVYAASHTPAETQDRIEQEQAFSDVWLSQYAVRFPGATLALSCPGVGNDIPVEVAAIAHEHGYFMDYHAYVPVKAGSVVAGEWPHYSGRWTEMDRRYKAAGYSVRWLFGEGGPVRQYDNGGLDSEGGWKHPDCCNGDPIKYGNIMAYWAGKVKAWNAANGRRAYAVNLFTTKQGGGAGSWTWFQTVQPVMDSMAALSQRYAESTPSPGPTPDPEPQPEPVPGNFTELVVVAPAGVNIRTQAGDIVGALPVDTRFVGKLIDGFWYLRGRVSANPELVRVAGEVVTPPPPEPPAPAGPLSGVDVSVHQGNIDWRLMKEKGVKVAGIKVSEGVGHVDAQWRANHTWARAYGIKVFPYHYYRNQVDYRLQAANFTSQAKQVSWDYPLAGDFEDNAPQPGLADDVRLFMEAAGVGIVYTNKPWWDSRIGFQPWAAQYLLWHAQWDVPETRIELPAGWSDWWGWQYKVTDGAAAWGVQSERLDLDKFKPLPLLTHWPVSSHALSNGGNTWGQPPGHEAVDLAARKGDLVYAAAAGVVKRVDFQPGGYGNYVRLQHGIDTETLYAHLETVAAQFGQEVAGGQKIGTAGSTGNSSGVHVHFELMVDGEMVDPWPHLQAI